jgi:hypothetical protein
VSERVCIKGFAKRRETWSGQSCEWFLTDSVPRFCPVVSTERLAVMYCCKDTRSRRQELAVAFLGGLMYGSVWFGCWYSVVLSNKGCIRWMEAT